ncbi:MAG: protein kinase [Polyangiaceae bacterium]
MQPTTLIAERFEIVRLAGTGGMGEVYCAQDRTSGEQVAVKVLTSPRPAEQARFAREADVLAGLRHPGIVRYVAHGTTAEGRMFLAMEWLEGEDLSARIARQPLPIADAVAVVRTTAEALAVAHARGIVHRDVKPANIFLVGGSLERAKVLDFGIAHLGHAPSQTATGVLVGTPEYMAPEQARGDRVLTPRTDVFALGAVLFECVTGRSAFTGAHVAAVLAKILLEEPPPLREVCPGAPSAVEALVARMLAKDPNDRPADAAAVLEELSALGGVTRDLRFSASVPPESLTRREQRLLSVIMITDPTVSEPEVGSAITLTFAEAARAAAPLRAAAEACGAQIEVLPGGSIMATITRAGLATDLAARAARCALELRAFAPGSLMAVATGRAELGGRLPAGDVIDRAVKMIYARRDRVETKAADSFAAPPSSDTGGPGADIAIDDVTAGLLGARFEIRADGGGLSLHREREAFDVRRLVLGRVIPCVGRDREIASLEAIFEECVEEEVARAVVMSGPPGIGKSRVRQELLERIARRGGAEVWVGRGDSMAAGSAFALVGQAIRSACGVQSAEPVAARQRKLRARVARHVAPPDVARVTEFLAEVIGAPFGEDASVQLRAARRDPVLLNDQVRRAWEDLLSAECRAQPVVLVLEDMQWGDLPSVRLVEAALSRGDGRSLFVIAVGRPEMQKQFPDMWSRTSLHTVTFGPLTRKASERLARHVLGDAANDADVTEIVARSGGDPLFIEELARAATSPRRGELPETVLAMVAARLDAFEAEARRVLRAGSVFGATFWLGGVTQLLGGAQHASETAEWLHELEVREVVARVDPSRIQGETEYTFRHAMLREAAYAMLTESDRTLGHRLAGRFLERTGETDAMALAGHFERGQMPAAAARAYLRAAEDALHGNDFDASLDRVQRGLACLIAAAAAGQDAETVEIHRSAPPAERLARGESGKLLLLEAEVRRWRGEFAEAERCAHEAMRRLPEGSEAWFKAGAEGILASGRLGRIDAMVEVAERLCACDAFGQDTDGKVHSLGRTVSQLVSAGRYDLADRIFARIDGAPPATDPAVIARVADARARRVIILGDLGGFLRLKEVALESALTAGDVRYATNARVSVGFAWLELGAYANAERALAAALESAARLGLSGVIPAAKQNLGVALAMLGRAEEARAVEEEAIAAFAAQAHRRMESVSRVYLSSMLARTGDLASAEREARLAVETAPAPPLRAHALAALSQILLSRGRRDVAFTFAAEAKAILDQLGAIEEGESLVRLAHAEAALETGQKDAHEAAADAREHLLARAAKIADPALRRSFLENVPENARTLALWDRVASSISA